MSALGIDLKAGLGSGLVSVSSVSSSGSSDDQAQLGVFSESGQMSATKEVRVAANDQTSRECLKQLNQEMASDDEIVDLNEEIVGDPESYPEENPVEDPKEDPEEDLEEYKEKNQIVSENEGEEDSYLGIEEAQEPEEVQALKKRLNESEDTWTADKRTKMRPHNNTEVLEDNIGLKNRLEKQLSALKKRQNELEMWIAEKRAKMRLHNITKGLEERLVRLNNRIEKQESAFRVSWERLLKRLEDYPSEEGQDGSTIDRSVFLKMVTEASYEYKYLAGP